MVQTQMTHDQIRTIDDLVEKLRYLRFEKKQTGYFSEVEYKKPDYYCELVFSLFASDDHFCSEYIPRLPIDTSELNIPVIGAISQSSRCIDEYEQQHNTNIPSEKKKIMRDWYIRNEKPVPKFLN